MNTCSCDDLTNQVSFSGQIEVVWAPRPADDPAAQPTWSKAFESKEVQQMAGMRKQFLALMIAAVVPLSAGAADRMMLGEYISADW